MFRTQRVQLHKWQQRNSSSKISNNATSIKTYQLEIVEIVCVWRVASEERHTFLIQNIMFGSTIWICGLCARAFKITENGMFSRAHSKRHCRATIRLSFIGWLSINRKTNKSDEIAMRDKFVRSELNAFDSNSIYFFLHVFPALLFIALSLSLPISLYLTLPISLYQSIVIMPYHFNFTRLNFKTIHYSNGSSAFHMDNHTIRTLHKIA